MDAYIIPICPKSLPHIRISQNSRIRTDRSILRYLFCSRHNDYKGNIPRMELPIWITTPAMAIVSTGNKDLMIKFDLE